MTYVDTEEDRQWRCMAIAMYFHRYLERLAELMRTQSIPITLTSLADYMEASLSNDHNDEFATWKFAVEECPRILRSLANDMGANGFNKMLSEGEYIPVVLILVTDVLAREPSACPPA